MRRWRALAVRRQAELNLSHTLVTPPIDDEIGHPQLAQREFVQAGTIQLMSVVRTSQQRRPPLGSDFDGG